MTQVSEPTTDGEIVREHLGHCPVCGSPARTMMFDDLTDRVFGVAPGRWTLHRCGGCDCAYLDPRPNPETIGRAYARYYTHGAGNPKRLPSRRRSLKGWLANGELNRGYGYRFPHAAPAWLAAALMRPLDKARQGAFIRHLPAPSAGASRLLDVGCGNGDFLQVARDCGYEVTGLEPDPQAVATARSQGLAVEQGTLTSASFAADSFDHITLSHVLEHVHAPAAALAQVLRLLKPGGRLWVSLPSLDAEGLRQFGADWIGLEPPRHLTLFTVAGLRRLLVETGFIGIEAPMPDPDASFYFHGSAAMAAGLDPYAHGALPDAQEVRRRVRQAVHNTLRDPSRNESVTLMAWKPSPADGRDVGGVLPPT